MPPKKKPKKSTLSARKGRASSSSRHENQTTPTPLSSFLVNVDSNILREIVNYWIGFPDEDEYQQRVLTARECVCRWVLAGLYASKVEGLASEHYDFGKIRAPAAERCLCAGGCSEMPDCLDLRDLPRGGNDFRFDAADLDCFVRISYRIFDRRKQTRPCGAQLCQGFVTGTTRSRNTRLFPGQDGRHDEFEFSLGGIYDEAVDKAWWEMTELLGFEARNHIFDDPNLERRREHLVKGALKSLAVTVVVIDRGQRPWRCRLLVATGGYGDIVLGTEGQSEDEKYLHESYFQLRGIQSHDPPVDDNRVAAAISISKGKLDRLKIRYNYGGNGSERLV